MEDDNQIASAQDYVEAYATEWDFVELKISNKVNEHFASIVLTPDAARELAQQLNDEADRAEETGEN
jgi:hypothetical protein